MTSFFEFLILWYGFYFISSCSFSLLSVPLLTNLKRMSTEKEAERDIDGVEVGGDDGVIIGFKDDMELGKKYGAQLGFKHVLELALMALLKNIKNGSNLGKNDAIDESIKNVLFIFDMECRNCR
jgi:hypothetical protein